MISPSDEKFLTMKDSVFIKSSVTNMHRRTTVFWFGQPPEDFWTSLSHFVFCVFSKKKPTLILTTFTMATDGSFYRCGNETVHSSLARAATAIAQQPGTCVWAERHICVGGRGGIVRGQAGYETKCELMVQVQRFMRVPLTNLNFRPKWIMIFCFPCSEVCVEK